MLVVYLFFALCRKLFADELGNDLLVWDDSSLMCYPTPAIVVSAGVSKNETDVFFSSSVEVLHSDGLPWCSLPDLALPRPQPDLSGPGHTQARAVN